MANSSAITSSSSVLSSSSLNDCTVFSFPHYLSFVLSLSSHSSLSYISSCCMWDSCTWSGIHSYASPFAVTIGVMLSSININAEWDGRVALPFRYTSYDKKWRCMLFAFNRSEGCNTEQFWSRGLFFHFSRLVFDPHSKRKRVFTEPSKKVPEIWNSVQMHRNALRMILQVYETFQGSSLGYTGRTFKYETFLKFRRRKKRFRSKIGNL